MFITLDLHITDIELILEHLEQGIYEEVAELISEINAQATLQIESEYDHLALAESESSQHDLEEPVLDKTAMNPSAEYVATEQPAPTL